MNFKASSLFAFRMLFPRTGKKSNARRSLVGAFLCIAISLVPLVMVLTVSNGMIKGMTDRMIGLSSSHLCCFLHPDIEEARSSDSLVELSRSLSEVEGVINVYPEISSVALAAGKAGRSGAQVRGVTTDIFTKNPSFRDFFECEGTPDLSKPNNAVIGKKLASDLNIKAGDDIRLISTRQLTSGKVIPKITKFKVTATVSSGYQELDSLWFFIPLEKAYSILPLRSSQIMIGIETGDAFSYGLEKTLSLVERRVPNFTRVYRWKELNTVQYENFSSTQMMLLFIMLLIVLVASVNISSALVMLVMERRKEIAILKSLGATSNGITVAFLITGLVTGFLGVFVGIPVGLLAAVNFDYIISFFEKVFNFLIEFVYLLLGMGTWDGQFILLDPAFYLQKIPLSIPLAELIIIGTGTLILSLVVSALPSIKAGKEKPNETLRKV